MKKILFITYYWPPSGKASLHFPLKLIKFLPEFGWQPTVLTVEEDKFSHKDESLLSEISPSLNVIKTKSNDPFNIYRKFLGKEKDVPLVASETISTANKSLNHKISVWIRMNLFVPDARVGWYFPAVKAGKLLLNKEKFDAIVSIGPPHTTHLIGKRLSKLFNIKHFPVLIDPWTDIIYYKNFNRNFLTIALDNYFEKSTLQNSSKSVFVTETMRDDYILKYPFLKNKSEVLYWGYNQDDFEKVGEVNKNSEFQTLLHAGNIFDYQNTPAFWNQVKKEIDNGRKLRIKFIGTVSPLIKESISKSGLADYTDYSGFLPYNKVLSEMLSADFLMVCATEPRHLPGKLFEYLRTGNPIIAFGDENNEVKKILEKNNAGMLFRYEQSGGEFFIKSSSFKTNIESVKEYDRKNITKKLSLILGDL